MKTNLCMRTFFIFPANINYLSTTQIDPEAELYCGKLADCVKLAPFQKQRTFVFRKSDATSAYAQYATFWWKCSVVLKVEFKAQFDL